MDLKRTHDNPGIRSRLMEEVRAYAIISLYLWVCFGTLLLYETSVLHADGVEFIPFGNALIKALILAKVLVMGRAMNVGGRITPNILFHRIVLKSLAILSLLLIFTAIEELIVGLVHNKETSEIVAEFLARSWLQNLAPSVVMLLVLVPMITFEEIDRVLGEGSLKRMLFGRSTPD